MVKNLLFDLGGVIMDICRENCVAAFRELGMSDPDEFLGEYSQKGPFAKIENGEWNEAQFHESIRGVIGKNVTDGEIDVAFNRFLAGIPEHRLDELAELHKRYRIYMLSNTNPIMWHSGIAREFGKQGRDVRYYFDGVVRSYKAGCMKPAPEIFELVIDKFGIHPGETIFLDDSETNTEAAAGLGFRTIWVEPGKEFYALLKGSGLID